MSEIINKIEAHFCVHNNYKILETYTSKKDKEYLETCLLNHHERNLLLADINEIIIFLEQRLINLENNTEINLSNTQTGNRRHRSGEKITCCNII